MEKRFVRVPFEIELAKRIQNNEVEGRIVTRDGKNVRVICWDRIIDVFPIVSLVCINEKESVELYELNGKWHEGEEDNDLDLMLEIPEYLTFRDGDVLLDKAGEPFIYNGVKTNGYGYICGINYDGRLCICNNENSLWTSAVKGRATEEEKQVLIDALKVSEEPKAKEYLKRFFGIEEKKEFEFKPFDKVLVRNSDDMQWGARHFDRMFEGDYACTDSLCYKQCIPYEGNEHLLGTKLPPKDDL